MFKGLFSRVIVLWMMFYAPLLSAQSPTSQQIKMFQSLPEPQQKALAAQYGISLPSSGEHSDNKLETPELMQSRVKNQSEPVQDLSFDLPSNDGYSNEEIKRFGLELFASSPSTFAPVSDVPVPSDYQVGPGDEIVVQLFGKENTTYRLIVNRDGAINFPSLGPITVTGMSFRQVRESLDERVKEQIIGVRADIALGELRTMQIFVMGDAYKPGAYTVSALTTISQAIYYSGGFSKSGSLRDIQLKRNGQMIRRLDLYQLLLNGDTSSDVRLMPGDVVLIGPVRDTVKVKGEVNRPAIYEIKPGETLKNVLQMAGGYTPDAYMEQASVTRLAPQGQRNITTLALTDSSALNIPLKNGDEVSINRRNNALQKYVQILGDVAQPGFVQWENGFHISDLFQSLDADFNTTADVDYALIVREINPQRDIRVYQFSLSNALLNTESVDNLALESRDQIIIFNRFDLNQLAGDKKGLNEQGSSMEKSFEQAINVAEKEQVQEQESLSGKSETIKVNVDKNGFNTRQALLAPILSRLNQQSIYGKPSLFVDITGAVKHPGRYPLAINNYKVKDLIAAAGGLTPEAYVKHSELSRMVVSGLQEIVSIESINLQAALSDDEANNLHLKPRDRLNVLEQPGFNQKNTITLRGEILFPGTYTVQRGTTLKQLIERAGGLTEFAHPQGAVFTREALRIQEEELLSEYAQDMRKEVAKKTFNADGNIGSVITNPDKTLAFVEEAAKSRALGRMVVQLDNIIDGDLNANFQLEDGDFLFVPTFRNTVSVMGEVQVGITYLLDKRLSIEDYISKAGGMKKQADEDRMFVVRADGSVFKPKTSFWFGGGQSEPLKAGDTIVVPVDTNYRDSLDVWTAATQILYQTGIAVNALK
ncbi:SLBB domain-containing protein [Vibrio diazotrophicus]|uniref:SLBB domain-containing protein n=1 Tax=Vibrio diazotrophicus TaxID=685 RepID=UPI000C9DAEC3|nr:SLBB domain-containing protein [Vibrio diazotrophicus]PNH80313.1 OtnA protein [Vibrio diazotrophicus]